MKPSGTSPSTMARLHNHIRPFIPGTLLPDVLFAATHFPVLQPQTTLSGRWHSEEDEMMCRDSARMACCQDCCVPDAYEVHLRFF